MDAFDTVNIKRLLINVRKALDLNMNNFLTVEQSDTFLKTVLDVYKNSNLISDYNFWFDECIHEYVITLDPAKVVADEVVGYKAKPSVVVDTSYYYAPYKPLLIQHPTSIPAKECVVQPMTNWREPKPQYPSAPEGLLNSLKV